MGYKLVARRHEFKGRAPLGRERTENRDCAVKAPGPAELLTAQRGLRKCLIAKELDMHLAHAPHRVWITTLNAICALATLAGAAELHAESLPLERIKLPPGFEIEVYARVPNARSLALGERGTVFVGTQKDAVYAIVPGPDGKREVLTVAQGLNVPNGVAVREGALYVAEISRILRFDAIETSLRTPPKPAVVTDRFPREGHHGWKYIAFGPDGWLYVPVGAPCNICEPDPDRYALISRIRPDGSDYQVYARGIRNSVGFDWHPRTGELWFNEHGRDMMGDDMPSDELNHAPKAGLHFGYPYCHQGDTPDPEFGRKHSCSEFTPPELKQGGHVAADGLKFYTGKMFPPEYRDRIFIAQHGSWNRSKKSGYRVIMVTLKGDKVEKSEVFADGWMQNEQAWGRPVDVLVLPDGALLISDDTADAVYRVSYRGR
jgi:glucose/arabinose dehydrogenase